MDMVWSVLSGRGLASPPWRYRSGYRAVSGAPVSWGFAREKARWIARYDLNSERETFRPEIIQSLRIRTAG
ncbi:hypothetical protein ASPTUDRAFT_46387 [Aspergillus tubingensis CBS 134.48]|uniref:Uncharacterized protein n=1 Tax=Aspergillus tubingensis (strain CBS 134.48) TaxID=767770 RepID=A0A1L9MVP9_ASPTC|nr:hypothetical protein ASPTUDRAFT_46387 [Aspergillus tubingensis CBS 134.48]